MSLSTRSRWIIGAVVALVLAVTVGPYVYIHFIKEKAPPRLSQSTTTVAGSGPVATSIEGTWKPTSASIVGYRVKEVLFGQSSEAVGRTSSVTGELTASGTTVSAASFTVDMATVKSPESQRDNQFRGRIMQVDKFPTATFKLTQPIALTAVPTEQGIKVKATGELTLHGVTKPVQVDLDVKRSGATFLVGGALNIVFADWSVANPSFGPAQTEDHGLLEWALVFAK
jgi:prepilin-type processing-associated H-X9-DG protein